MMLDEKIEWRCPVCDRLLSAIVSGDIIEVETGNRQRIVIDSVNRTAYCKCGAILTASGIMSIISFGNLSPELSTGEEVDNPKD